MAGAVERVRTARAPSASGGRARVALAWLLIAAALFVVWEGAKWLFGDPWRIHATVLGLPIDIEHDPPFDARIATDQIGRASCRERV